MSEHYAGDSVYVVSRIQSFFSREVENCREERSENSWKICWPKAVWIRYGGWHTYHTCPMWVGGIKLVLVFTLYPDVKMFFFSQEFGLARFKSNQVKAMKGLEYALSNLQGMSFSPHACFRINKEQKQISLFWTVPVMKRICIGSHVLFPFLSTLFTSTRVYLQYS